MSQKLFGTDGIRGIANRHPMTAELALKVGRAVAYHFRGRSQRTDQQSIILIGKDTRRSSYMIEQALAAGITSQGAFALLVGPIPTPGVSFLTKSMRADAGVMVSASHNTYEYNGIKLFGHDGFKLPDETELEIERLILENHLEENLPTGAGLGRAKRIDDAMGRYVVHTKSSFPSEFDLKGFKIVLDTANGAAYRFAPIVFEELGAEVIHIANTPNGVNINHECGALHAHRMAELVKEHRADIGIALDGDADRVILADDEGNVVDGDQLMALIACEWAKTGRLSKNTLVATPMSNMGLEIALLKNGINVKYAGIGDRSVMDMMRKNAYNVGGEQSGHIIFLDYSATGDGVVAALAAMSVMKRKNQKLSELRGIVTVFPQVLRNIRVTKKPALDSVPSIQKAIRDTEDELKGRGRVLVRYSGTEPLCRVMVEADDEVLMSKLADRLQDLITTELA